MQSEQVRMSDVDGTQVGNHQDGVNTRLGEVYLLPREAVDIVKPRVAELRTLVRDAWVHIQSDVSHTQQEAVHLLFDRICQFFNIEPVRVHVEVIGDDEVLSWSDDKAVFDVLRKRFPSLGQGTGDLDVFRVTRWNEYVMLYPPFGFIWNVRLRTEEMGAFQTSLYAKYLLWLLYASSSVLVCYPGRDTNGVVDHMPREALSKDWQDALDWLCDIFLKTSQYGGDVV